MTAQPIMKAPGRLSERDPQAIEHTAGRFFTGILLLAGDERDRRY
jgi:hypothetical protein